MNSRLPRLERAKRYVIEERRLSPERIEFEEMMDRAENYGSGHASSYRSDLNGSSKRDYQGC